MISKSRRALLKKKTAVLKLLVCMSYKKRLSKISQIWTCNRIKLNSQQTNFYFSPENQNGRFCYIPKAYFSSFSLNSRSFYGLC